MTHSAVFIHDDANLWELFDRLATELTGHGVPVLRGRIPPEELRDADALRTRLDGIKVAVFSSRSACPRLLIESVPGLRGIVAPTIGTETIDIAAATDHGVLVANGATQANVLSMAESTVMQILNLLYRPDLSTEVILGQRPRPDGRERPRWARTLAGRKVAVLGYGRIGQAVAARLLSFRAHVSVITRDGNAPPPSLPTPPGLRFGGLRDILPETEILTLHADARAGQPALIGAAELDLLPAGALVVNTARGQLLDEAALAAALTRGHVAAAALDTFAVEPLPQDSPLRQLDNVFLTPHLVGHTREMFDSFLPVALENVLSLLADETPRYCRNPDAIPAWQARSRGPTAAATTDVSATRAV